MLIFRRQINMEKSEFSNKWQTISQTKSHIKFWNICFSYNRILDFNKNI